MTAITGPQLKRLQVLYGQYERHSLDCDGADRASRMQWASKACKRPISSFKELTIDDARFLIDDLQRVLQTKAPNQQPRRCQTRKDGEKKGTEGRHDQIHAEATLVGPQDTRRLLDDMSRLGWDERRLEAFLASRRGPLKGSTVIRTLGDANKVHWALKRLHRENTNAA